MSEKIIENKVSPQTESIADNAESMPSSQTQIFVPVKFNKKILNLDLQKAQELAQKGMKYDAISKDYDALRDLAKEEGLSVGEFILSLKSRKENERRNAILEKCGGDSEFAEHILKLEKGKKEEVKGFSELKDNFPEFKDLDDLPESVVEAAKLKGTLLLDEFLRYRHSQDIAAKSSIKEQRDARMSAMGSFSNKNGGASPETAEFLRGLWQR